MFKRIPETQNWWEEKLTYHIPKLATHFIVACRLFLRQVCGATHDRDGRRQSQIESIHWPRNGAFTLEPI